MNDMPVPDAAEEPDRLAELAAVGASLGVAFERLDTSVTALTEELRGERRRGRRRDLSLAMLTLGLVLDIVLTGAIAALAWGQVRANNKIEESLRAEYVTAQQQAQTRVRVLCPLYEVLLGAAADPSPQSQATPAAKARYDAAVKTIRDGYTALGCQPPLPATVPSGSSSAH